MRQILKKFKRFGCDARGIAAMEFAIILPFLMMLILGSASVFDYIKAKNDAQRATDIMADLVTRSMEMDDDEFETIVDAAELILARYGDRMTVQGRVTAYKLVDEGKKWEVEWSKSRNMPNLKKGDKIGKDNYPTNHAKDMVVSVETSVIYDNEQYMVDMAPLTFKKETVRLPRYASKISYADDIDYANSSSPSDTSDGGGRDGAPEASGRGSGGEDDGDDGDNDQGHGNDDDGHDEDNPGNGDGSNGSNGSNGNDNGAGNGNGNGNGGSSGGSCNILKWLFGLC